MFYEETRERPVGHGGDRRRAGRPRDDRGYGEVSAARAKLHRES